MRHGILFLLTAAFVVALGAVGYTQDQRPPIGFKDTPLLPGGQWHVHDGDRPQPPVVTPAPAPEQPVPAPSDAIVLFEGSDLSGWRNPRGNSAGWEVVDGAIVVKPGTGDILSRQEFGDCQLHIEFATPENGQGRDQGRGNSGVMFFNRYEIQVLDSFENITYADGQAAAIYGQFPPLVNASRPPGEWQTYDIIFTRPRFNEDGSVQTPAYVTVLHNGVLAHNHQEILGPMVYRGQPQYRPHGPKGPLLLQDHSHPVRYRNIWVRDLEPADDAS